MVRLAAYLFSGLLRGMLLCSVLLSGCASNGPSPLSVGQARYDFERVVAKIESHYVEPVSVEALLDDAIEGMYRFTGMTPLSEAELMVQGGVVDPVFDPADPLFRFSLTYSYLLNHYPPPVVHVAPVPQPEVVLESSEQVGIGITLAHDGEWIRIASVVIDSAAERVGLNRGDGIIAIDGHPTAGKSLAWCYQQLTGAVGSKVKVKVNTEEGTVIDYQITRIRPYIPIIVWLGLPPGVG